ncbi:hypothetical protein PMAYCL1PPCAC_33479, partial [Pristionchus mayeri]
EYRENSRVMNFHENHSVELLKQIARAIGKLNAFSLLKEPMAPELQKKPKNDSEETNNAKGFSGMFKGLVTRDKSDKAKHLLDLLDAISPDYMESNFTEPLIEKMQLRQVLVNGDLNNNNVLVDKDTGDLVALIDWQCTHLGFGLEDLHRIAMYSLRTEDRHAYFPALIKEMYTSMVDNLDGADHSYTLEKLLLLSDLILPQCALHFGASAIAFISNHARDPSFSDDEKAKRNDLMMVKLIGALEDAIKFDAKN